MNIVLKIPELANHSIHFSNYWLNVVFSCSPSKNHIVNVLANTYMRLTEASIIEYQLGKDELHKVWSDHSSVGIRSLHRSISHFEKCITDIHRSIAVYKKLRSRATAANDPLIKYLSLSKPSFIDYKLYRKVTAIRDLIHHTEGKLLAKEITEDQFGVLAPFGSLHTEAGTGGQTVKTIDRVKFGMYELTFEEISKFINELSEYAAKIATFNPNI